MKIHKEPSFRACVLECGGHDAAFSLGGTGNLPAALPPVHRKNRQKENGFVATVEFIALLAIMVLLATANAMALYHLHREVRVLEQQQITRLNASETNSVATVHFNLASTDSK